MSKPHPTYLRLKEFLETREVCHRASAPMKGGAVVRILFTDHEEIYSFSRRDGRPRLEAGKPASPDFTLRLPTTLVEHLHGMETNDIGEFGVTLISMGLSKDPAHHIQGTIHSGFVDLWRKGYFGILRLGGWPVAKLLATKGLVSIGVIRRKINENMKPAE